MKIQLIHVYHHHADLTVYAEKIAAMEFALAKNNTSAHRLSVDLNVWLAVIVCQTGLVSIKNVSTLVLAHVEITRNVWWLTITLCAVVRKIILAILSCSVHSKNVSAYRN